MTMADSMEKQSQEIKKAGQDLPAPSSRTPKEERQENPEKPPAPPEPKMLTPKEMLENPKDLLEDPATVDRSSEPYWQDLQYIANNSDRAAVIHKEKTGGYDGN